MEIPRQHRSHVELITVPSGDSYRQKSHRISRANALKTQTRAISDEQLVKLALEVYKASHHGRR